MTPRELELELAAVVRNKIMDPLLILGEPGIGKTAIVRKVFAEKGVPVTDVRWGQLMPADARGVPVVDRTRKATEFYPPAFWPREGPAAIFLDEFNQASAAMMGLAQQLLLDRRFGDYSVPPGTFVWAAGNRKVDHAVVSEIPGPVANRVAHYEVEHDFPSWESWAHEAGVETSIVGFLKWRPELLHKFDPAGGAWPSPRTWEMASRRHAARMSVAPVVGEHAEAEFGAYVLMVEQLPDLRAIAAGRTRQVPFPEEPSLRYAAVSGLTRESLGDFGKFRNSFSWLSEGCRDEPDWVGMFVQDFVRISKAGSRSVAPLLRDILGMPELARFLGEHAQ